MAFLAATEQEVMYGGATGGGKSESLLMAALQWVDVPTYAAILFRRTFTDLSLPGALMDRSHEWLEGKARWHAQSARWTFESGATLTFGYIDSASDKYRYQSAEFQFIAFDELTQFREADYRFMFSRLRRAKSATVPLRMRSASNPGGAGHDWVKRRFVDPGEDGTRFIPATMYDNPNLDHESYRQWLLGLDPITRRQYLDGDWAAGEDGIVDYSWILAAETNQRPPTSLRPERYIGVDVGRSRDRTVIWTWEKVGDVCWCTDLLVLAGVPFAQQADAIKSRLNSTVVRCQIDKGYNPQLAEDLERQYPGKVVGVQLTQGRQGQFAAQLANGFESRRVRIPQDDDLRADLRLVRRVEIRSGVPVVATDRDRTGHADRFWAAALGYDAAHWSVRQPRASTPGAHRPRGF